MKIDLMNTHMQDCITTCWDCRTLCHKTLYEHCLAMGGNHIEQQHVKSMTDCIEICQVAADFMTRNSPNHMAICAACAEVCYACAESCEKVGGEEMLACAQLCRECAESCDKMSLQGVQEGLFEQADARSTLI